MAEKEISKMADFQEQLLRLQLIKLQREEKERAEAEELARNARMIGMSALIQERENELQHQQACPHLKPNGQSAIAGQRDHRNHYHWICQYCAKEWYDQEVPLHLRVDLARVGGPDLS